MKEEVTENKDVSVTMLNDKVISIDALFMIQLNKIYKMSYNSANNGNHDLLVTLIL